MSRITGTQTVYLYNTEPTNTPAETDEYGLLVLSEVKTIVKECLVAYNSSVLTTTQMADFEKVDCAVYLPAGTEIKDWSEFSIDNEDGERFKVTVPAFLWTTHRRSAVKPRIILGGVRV